MHDVGGARIRVDRRGCWLLVDEGVPGVHLNGRPVRRTALLRAGDCVHVAGGSVLLEGQVAPPPPTPGAGHGEPGHGRMLLRAIGGRHHGRGFSLDRARVLGSGRDADIRLDPALPARAARIACEQGRVVLRGLDGVDSTVNGLSARDAELRPGDQLLFGSRDRFVLEVPSLAPGAGDGDEIRSAAGIQADGTVGVAATAVRRRRLPWLLLAALLIAAALSALLLL
jgi:hypothetical protein